MRAADGIFDVLMASSVFVQVELGGLVRIIALAADAAAQGFTALVALRRGHAQAVQLCDDEGGGFTDYEWRMLRNTREQAWLLPRSRGVVLRFRLRPIVFVFPSTGCPRRGM